MSTDTTARIVTAEIEADPTLPIIRIVRDFHATPEQLVRAHTDADLFVRWVGPNSLETTVDYWEGGTGGKWAYTVTRDDFTTSFFGSFHEIRADRLVQTFTWAGMPDGVSLDTMTFEDLGDGWTRMHATSLVDSLEGRDAMLASGMDVGVNEGYAKLDGLLADGAL